MKANISRDALGNIVIQMEGDLNYEYGHPFRMELQSIQKANPNLNITIDLGGVDFVGSSGISHFVETLKLARTVAPTSQTISLANVKTEFIRVFKLYSLEDAELIAQELDFDNDETDQLNSRFGNRNRTFEN